MFSAWSCELRWKKKHIVSGSQDLDLWLSSEYLSQMSWNSLGMFVIYCVLKNVKSPTTVALNFDFCPPSNSYELIFESKRAFCTKTRRRWSQDIAFKRPQGCFVVTSNFDLWPPKSKLFISESKWMLVENLKTFPQGIPEILCSPEWDRRVKTRNASSAG